MHNTPPQTHPRALIFGWLLGGFGFLLSFALAVTMLVRQGAPGFLLIWAVALFATAACMRAQARWRRSLERMFSPDTAHPFQPTRRRRQLNVEDITFRDIPAR